MSFTSRWRKRWRGCLVLVALLGLYTTNACSVLYDLNTTQCEQDSDCDGLGFRNTVCQNKLCVTDAAGSGGVGGTGGATGGASMGGAGSNGAGTGGEAGDGSGGVGGKAGGTGGKGGSTGNGGTAGVGGGEGGSGAVPECATHADCIADHSGEPWLCRDGVCLELTNDDCPILLPYEGGLDYLRNSEAPALLGGMTLLNENSAYDSTSVVNWDLALSEFNQVNLDTERPLMAVVCNDVPAKVLPNFDHLALNLKVPGMLTTLSPDLLLSAYNHTSDEDYVAAGGRSVFLLSNLSADLRLADFVDRGLIWHMIGSPRVLAATIAAIVRRIEPYVQARREENYALTNIDDPTTPLRVTLVTADDLTLTDLSIVLTSGSVEHPESNLTFNGELAILQTNEFRSVEIQSIRRHAAPDYQTAIDEVRGNPPHIVVALASGEFANVLPGIENAWGQDAVTMGHMRPYYVVSHVLNGFLTFGEAVAELSSVTPPVSERIVGVSFAMAHDERSELLYAAYLSRLLGHYGTGGGLETSLPGTENFYDAAYGLMYAYAGAAANGSDVTATALREAFQDRVFSNEPGAESISIGPGTMPDAMQVLSSLNSSMALWGTMGSPDFDRASGTRVTNSSAWCIEVINSTATYVQDALLYDPETGTFYPPAGSPGSCLAQY